MDSKICAKCKESKPLDSFYAKYNKCKDCNNAERRERRATDDEHRAKLQAQSRLAKSKRTAKRLSKKIETRLAIEAEIGSDNQICSTCKVVHPKSNFREVALKRDGTNLRLQCKDCERLSGRIYRQSDIGKEKAQIWIINNRERMTELNTAWARNKMENDPIFKIISLTRSRTTVALSVKNYHTIDYLGCSGPDFCQWLIYCMKNYPEFTMANHGRLWHIDHVIPIAKFDISNEDQQFLAFNWRNCMPLAVKKNLSKGKKILIDQVEAHLKCLEEFHSEFGIEFPENFRELFARHLLAGNS